MGPNFKIKLSSGRILGPLDLERVKVLILNQQITGQEEAREHPTGEWKPIQSIPALATLLLAHLEGKLKVGSSAAKSADTGAVPQGSTQILPGAKPTKSISGTLPELPETPSGFLDGEDGGKTVVINIDGMDVNVPVQLQETAPVEEEKTKIGTLITEMPVPSSGLTPWCQRHREK